MSWNIDDGTPLPPAIELPSAHASALHEVARIEARLERLLLVTRSLWILTKESTGLSDEQLARLVGHLDNQDGQADGRHRRAATQCPKCEAVISPKYNRCLFCGETGRIESPFDAV